MLPRGLGRRVAWRSSARALSGAAKQEAPSRRPRFYKAVGVGEEGGSWFVSLDGRRVPTPAGSALVVPSRMLALSLAAEWDAQVRHIEPATMPLTSLAATAVDQVSRERSKVVEGLLRYAATDTCRFFVDGAQAPEVRERQEALLEPVLAWLRRDIGVDLRRAADGAFRAPPVDAASLARLRELCDGYDAFGLAALQCAVFECKSLALGLALLRGRLDARAAEAAARVEETANIDRWGLVEGAHDYDLARIQVQLASASFFFDASRPTAAAPET